MSAPAFRRTRASGLPKGMSPCTKQLTTTAYAQAAAAASTIDVTPLAKRTTTRTGGEAPTSPPSPNGQLPERESRKRGAGPRLRLPLPDSPRGRHGDEERAGTSPARYNASAGTCATTE